MNVALKSENLRTDEGQTQNFHTGDLHLTASVSKLYFENVVLFLKCKQTLHIYNCCHGRSITPKCASVTFCHGRVWKLQNNCTLWRKNPVCISLCATVAYCGSRASLHAANQNCVCIKRHVATSQTAACSFLANFSSFLHFGLLDELLTNHRRKRDALC